MHAIDIYGDPKQETLVKIAQETPGVVDRLSAIGEFELDNKDELSDNAFAWPEERMYPVYTKEAALLSSVYLESAEVPQHVKDNCIEACAAFDVQVEIGSFEKVASEEGLSPSDFVLPGRQKLPVVDADTYATSESLFLSNLDDFTLDETVIGARQLVKKASDMSIGSDPMLTQLGLSGQLNVERAKELSMDRYSETADAEYLSISEKLAGQSYSSIEKIAEWVVDMSGLDNVNGVVSSASLFGAIDPIEKTASLILDNIEVPFEKIAQIDEGEWSDIIDRDTISCLFEDGDMSHVKLAEMMSDCSDIEYDIMSSFIKNKTRN